MIVMTDGLRELAGAALRARLIRITRSPLSGALSGATTTAILQSSSATTVMAVGFVSAGLLTFPQALGVIFGANIGTTITGWMVALLGFKLKLGLFVLPLILIGAIMRLFGHGRLPSIGYALAGFGLLFVGITFMQQGMGGISEFISPENMPPDTLIGRLQLVLLGMLITVITQSSSAGVAVTLTALYAGDINFHQAAAIVIGMDVGTTIKALIATIGSSIDSRRTGTSHVIYNFFTAIGALLLITPYVFLWESIAPGELATNAEIALVAFHTMFNTLGVIIVLPFTSQFAHFIERIIPDKGPAYTSKLDRALLDNPDLALKAVQESIHSELTPLLKHINAILGNYQNVSRINLEELHIALDRTQDFVDQIQVGEKKGLEWDRLIAIIHTLDHMQRLHERCEEDEDRANVAVKTIELKEYCQLITETNIQVIDLFEEKQWNEAARIAENTYESIRMQIDPLRESMMTRVGSGEIDVPTGTGKLEAIRWLRRVSKHVARITHHYEEIMMSVGQKP